MKIPLKYNIRSLWVRRVGTLMTAVGIGLTVAVLVTMMALVTGLESTFVETGHDNDLVVIRKGAQSETNSYFNRNLFQTVQFLPGVEKDSNNTPWAVGELIVVINHDRLDGEPSNVVVRGTSDRGFEMRPEIKIVEGRRFKKGVRELVVSRSLSRRFKDMRVGDTLPIAHNKWSVVGIFDAAGTAYGSEIWGDYDEIALEWRRPVYSSILLRVESPEAAREIDERISGDRDRRVQLQAMTQKEYYSRQAVSSVGVKMLGYFIAVVMGVGSCFAAMNMMYATIMARFKEIGTLRALGFRRRSILASFVMESAFLAVLGGAIGCLLALPVNGVSTGTTNFVTFSEVLFNFRITPSILFTAMAFSLVVGLLGGFLPAVRAARLRLIEALAD
ncbi:MAG: ABC transporter permease [Acidobacteriota bacterium]